MSKQKNIIKNVVNDVIQKFFLDRRFLKETIVNEVLLYPEIYSEMAHRKKALPEWPDEEAYRCYIKKLVTKRISRNIRLKLGDQRQNIREFWSVEELPGGRCVYVRVTSMTIQEMRVAGNSYLHLGEKNMAKGKILLTLADKVEQENVQPTDDLLKEVAIELRAKGEI